MYLVLRIRIVNSPYYILTVVHDLSHVYVLQELFADLHLVKDGDKQRADALKQQGKR